MATPTFTRCDTAKKKEAAGNGSMTKTDAVRAAMAEGVEKPQGACEWIKTKFDIDITPAHFSSYKSGFKKKNGEAAPRTRAAAAGPRVGNGSPVELARQVKKLVDTYGVAAVEEMATVFE
jgi:hypothetical protein